MQSSTSKLPSFGYTVFVDRSLDGKRLVRLLEAVGIQVESHKDHFKHDEDDHIWIPEIVSRGWLILTGDKRITKDPENVAAVDSCQAQIVMTTDTNSLPEDWAASFIVGKNHIAELFSRRPGQTLVIKISKQARDHVKVHRGKNNEKSSSREELVEEPPSAPESLKLGPTSAEPNRRDDLPRAASSKSSE